MLMSTNRRSVNWFDDTPFLFSDRKGKPVDEYPGTHCRTTIPNQSG